MGSGPSKKTLTTSTVVIVGGGFGGVELAKILSGKGVSVTLITATDFFFNTTQSLLACTHESGDSLACKPYSSFFKGKFSSVKVEQGVVVEIEENSKEVILESGKKITYHILVLATGAGNAFPNAAHTMCSSGAAFIEITSSIRSSLTNATTVAIVGGGPVGVELAGFISSYYPSHKIHLFHSGKAPLDNLVVPIQQKTIKKIEGFMTGKVIPHYGEKVDLSSIQSEIQRQNGKLPPSILDKTGQAPFMLNTQSGLSTPVDMVFVCIGNANSGRTPAIWNSAFFRSHAHESHPGRLKVDSHLHVSGTEIFALGDCAYLEENPMAYYAAKMHAPVVAANVYSTLAEKKASKTYAAQKKAALILPFGTKLGVSEIGGMNLGSNLTQTFHRSKGK